jgi:TonB family protein
MTMNIKKQLAGPVLRYGLIVPATLLLLSVAAGGAVMAVVVEPQSPSQAASQAAPLGHIYKIGKDVSVPVPLNTVLAKFPKAALETNDKTEGICLISAVVDETGMPQDFHVVRSLRPDFDANAIQAVKQYRFQPAQRRGNPVAVRINIQVNFKRY